MSNPFTVSGDLTDQDLARLYRFQVREQANFALFAISPVGQIATWNRGVEHIFGYSEEEWLGQDTAVIFVEEDRADDVARREMEGAKKKGSSADIRWHLRKDGTRIYLRGVLTAIHDTDGAFLGFTKTVIDDTARKNLEDALTQSNSDLLQFASAASHDLQEPLRTLSTYSEVLDRRYRHNLDAEADEILGWMTEAAARLSGLIADLLAYSQLASEAPEVTSVDLNEDWESAVSLLRSSIEEVSATITHDPLPKVMLDRSQLVRLFQNLLANSIKFRKPAEAPHIHAWAERRGSEWIVRVKDNGIGFPPEHAGVIFAPFKRLHSTREYAGSGIGLAVCKRIVEGWGGRIGAESRPGAGSTFWFTLPAV